MQCSDPFQTSTGVIEVQLASGQQNNNLQSAAVVSLGKPAELRDEDIIENLVSATTVATTTPNSNVITLTSPDQTFTKTIVIENFSDHPPEMQRDILNAILNSDVGCGASTAIAPGGETVATLPPPPPPPIHPQPPPIVEAQPIAMSMADMKAPASEAAAPAGQPLSLKVGDEHDKAATGGGEDEAAFAPISASEFEDGSGSNHAPTPPEDPKGSDAL